MGVSGFLHAVTGFIAENPHYAYAAVLLLALSESLPVIGAFIPGSAVIIALSALVPGGTLKLWPLLAVASAGAIIGDGFAYWLGHRYNRAILDHWPLKRQPGLVAVSEAFFNRHGNKSVFIARFTPGVRAIVPLFAGILRMPARRFYAANVLSALVWAPSHILPGVLAGASLGYFGAAAEPVAIIALMLVAFAWFLLQVLRLFVRKVLPSLVRWLEVAHGWAAARDTRFSRAVAAVLEPERSEARLLLALGLLLLGAAWLFLGILEDVVSGDQLVNADQSIYRALQDLRSAPGDAVMITITELGDTVVVIGVAAAVFLYLLWIRAWRTSAYWLAAVGGASALNTIIKLALHRPRPGELFYTGASAFSFPSGHSTTNMAMYGFLGFLVAREVRPALRPSVGLAAIVMILLIAMSRLYLGAHWFSDVAAGLAFGTLWLSALIMSYLRRPVPLVGAGRLLAIALCALGLGGGVNIYRHHALDVSRYAVQLPPVQSMTAAQWLAEGWKQLPAYRVGLGGETEEPLAIQWAGSLDILAATLQAQGWQTALPLSPASALAFAASGVQPAVLPVMPHFESGQLPGLTMVRGTGTETRIVLRLWPAGVNVDGASPVWVGSAVEERVHRTLGLLTTIDVSDQANLPRDAVAGAVQGGGLVTRTAVSPDWDGRVWLGMAPR